MKIFTKLLLTTSIMLSGYIYAQQDTNSVPVVSSSVNSKYSFDGEWKILNNFNNYIVNGSKVTNNSKKTSKTLLINLYFIPVNQNSNLNLNNIPNKVSDDIILGKLEGKGTSYNNVIISFKDSDIKNLKKDNYIPLVVLREKASNKILNYKFLNDRIILEENKILINSNQVTGVENSQTKPDYTSEKTIGNVNQPDFDNPKPFDNYVTTESSIKLDNINKNLKFDGSWRLSVDFENLLINIDGQNNSITNSSSNPTNNLKLLVYFSRSELINGGIINGFDLASIDLAPIRGYHIVQNPTYKTNITKLVPPGDYYPVLVLLEKNDQGEYTIKSMLSLGDKYTWK